VSNNCFRTSPNTDPVFGFGFPNVLNAPIAAVRVALAGHGGHLAN
jgi:hypothetical protein